MQLVERVAHAYGVSARPGGKAVWFELLLPQASA
jgi:hypothetical protein